MTRLFQSRIRLMPRDDKTTLPLLLLPALWTSILRDSSLRTNMSRSITRIYTEQITLNLTFKVTGARGEVEYNTETSSMENEKNGEREVCAEAETGGGNFQAESWVVVSRELQEEQERKSGKTPGIDIHVEYQIATARAEAAALAKTIKTLSESTSSILGYSSSLLAQVEEISTKAGEVRESINQLFDDSTAEDLDEIRARAEGVEDLAEDVESEVRILDEKVYSMRSQGEEMKDLAKEMEKRVRKMLFVLGGYADGESADPNLEGKGQAAEVKGTPHVALLPPSFKHLQGTKRKFDDQPASTNLPARTITHDLLNAPSLGSILEKRAPGLQKVVREYHIKKLEAEGRPAQLTKAANGIFALDMSDPGLRNIVEEYLNKQQISEMVPMKEPNSLVLNGSIDGNLLRLKEVRGEEAEEKASKEPVVRKGEHENEFAERATLINPSDYEFRRMMMEYLNKKIKTGQGPLDFRVEITTRWESSD